MFVHLNNPICDRNDLINAVPMEEYVFCFDKLELDATAYNARSLAAKYVINTVYLIQLLLNLYSNIW